MTLADLIASALTVCPDCHLPIYPGEEADCDPKWPTLYHLECPSFPAAHRPAPREGIVEQLNDVRLDWR